MTKETLSNGTLRLEKLLRELMDPETGEYSRMDDQHQANLRADIRQVLLQRPDSILKYVATAEINVVSKMAADIMEIREQIQMMPDGWDSVPGGAFAD